MRLATPAICVLLAALFVAGCGSEDSDEAAPAACLAGAKTYARGVAIIYAVLTIMGLVPALNTTLGYIPIYGNDVWLHAVLALIAAYFGWMHRDTAGV